MSVLPGMGVFEGVTLGLIVKGSVEVDEGIRVCVEVAVNVAVAVLVLVEVNVLVLG